MLPMPLLILLLRNPGYSSGDIFGWSIYFFGNELRKMLWVMLSLPCRLDNPVDCAVLKFLTINDFFARQIRPLYVNFIKQGLGKCLSF
jgi:hypothetical protein